MSRLVIAIAAACSMAQMARADQATATDTFVIEAGWIVRQSVIDAVTAQAWKRGLECKHEVAGRAVRFTVSGEPNKVKAFVIGIGFAFPSDE